MNHAFHSLVLLTAIATSSLGQSPQPAAQRSAPPPPITSKDVRVIPYSREHEKTSLDGKRGHPDDLRVATTTNKIHLYGKKRVPSIKVDGRLICHSGKLALLAPVDRAGKLYIKVPSADDVTYYYGVFEFRDGTLNPKELKMEVKKTYDWSFTSNAGQSTFRVVDGQAELMAITAPTDKIKGFGFSSTVRQKDNESDLTFTVE